MSIKVEVVRIVHACMFILQIDESSGRDLAPVSCNVSRLLRNTIEAKTLIRSGWVSVLHVKEHWPFKCVT